MKKIKTSKQRNIKNRIIQLLTLAFIICFIFSIFKMINYYFETKRINKQEATIIKNTDIVETKDNENTIIIEQQAEETDLYWYYIKQNLITVNFKDLLDINNETVGWIQVPGTNINYPFVQTNNNDYYLNHSFDKNVNSAGWVFLDYRNSISNIEEKNTILYAHGRLDKTMFGSLKNVFSSGWLNDKENHIIKMSTQYENTLWQVFSIYRIPTTSDYLQISFNSNEEYIKFLNVLLNRSSFNFDTNVNENDRILTLSTCYNDKDKIVLHAKLIKKEKRY